MRVFLGFVNKELRAGDTAAPFDAVLLQDRLGSANRLKRAPSVN
jgi:hypothetical protein